LEQIVLHDGQGGVDLLAQSGLWNYFFRAGIAAFEHNVAGGQVARAKF
jgi:hypothetical protein